MNHLTVLRALIADDTHAATFQSLGQYRTELLSFAASLPAAPMQATLEGWRLAPKVATPAMVIAGQDSGKNISFSYQSCYAAMLTAAPIPPQSVELTDAQIIETVRHIVPVVIASAERQVISVQSAKMIARAILAASPVQAPEGWRPIKTAPRDGRNILVCFGQDGVSQAKYIPGLPHPWQFIDTNDGISWLVNLSVDGPGGPSHWMSMPAAPAPGEQA